MTEAQTAPQGAIGTEKGWLCCPADSCCPVPRRAPLTYLRRCLLVLYPRQRAASYYRKAARLGDTGCPRGNEAVAAAETNLKLLSGDRSEMDRTWSELPANSSQTTTTVQARAGMQSSQHRLHCICYPKQRRLADSSQAAQPGSHPQQAQCLFANHLLLLC